MSDILTRPRRITRENDRRRMEALLSRNRANLAGYGEVMNDAGLGLLAFVIRRAERDLGKGKESGTCR
jgi:hypothetical protein